MSSALFGLLCVSAGDHHMPLMLLSPCQQFLSFVWHDDPVFFSTVDRDIYENSGLSGLLSKYQSELLYQSLGFTINVNAKFKT